MLTKGSEFFLLKVGSFSEGFCLQESKQEVIKVVSSVKIAVPFVPTC